MKIRYQYFIPPDKVLKKLTNIIEVKLVPFVTVQFLPHHVYCYRDLSTFRQQTFL